MLVGQLWTSVLLLSAMVGAGAGISAAISRRLELPTGTRVALIGTTGFTFVGVATLIVGHLHLFGPWLPYGLAVAGGILGVLGRRELVEISTTRAWRGISRQFKTYPIPLSAVSLALVLAAAASLTRPSRRDEVEYHWPAPLAWAENGGWNDSPFRHVDGFPFMEIVYTSAATQQSYVAAHLLHFAMFLTLGFAVAGVAASMGVRGTGVTAATVLAMPVVWDSAYAAYNDTPVATLTITAVGVVLAAPRDRLAGAAIAGALLAVATSIKPIALAGVGLIGLMVLMQFLTARRSAADASAVGSGGHQALRTVPRLRTVLLQWVLLAAPVLVTLAFWSLRQLLVTGHLVDPAATGEGSVDAMSRLPTTVDRIIAPASAIRQRSYRFNGAMGRTHRGGDASVPYPGARLRLLAPRPRTPPVRPHGVARVGGLDRPRIRGGAHPLPCRLVGAHHRRHPGGVRRLLRSKAPCPDLARAGVDSLSVAGSCRCLVRDDPHASFARGRVTSTFGMTLTRPTDPGTGGQRMTPTEENSGRMWWLDAAKGRST